MVGCNLLHAFHCLMRMGAVGEGEGSRREMVRFSNSYETFLVNKRGESGGGRLRIKTMIPKDTLPGRISNLYG